MASSCSPIKPCLKSTTRRTSALHLRRDSSRGSRKMVKMVRFAALERSLAPTPVVRDRVYPRCGKCDSVSSAETTSRILAYAATRTACAFGTAAVIFFTSYRTNMTEIRRGCIAVPSPPVETTASRSDCSKNRGTISYGGSLNRSTKNS